MRTFFLLLGLLFLSIKFCKAQNDTTKYEEPVPNSNYNRGAGTNPNNYSNGSSNKNNAGNDTGTPGKKKSNKNSNSSPAATPKRKK